ncbi:MAG: DUF5312 domain-containing protein [Treponema sp.]|jgi:hypothetical protein|nr:DUF5312 domain-containing protein [Treponema sp.]
MADIFHGDGSLNQLVSKMSSQERHELLEKLKVQTVFSETHYETADDRVKSVIQDEDYAQLPLFTRFFLFLTGLFKGKPAPKVFEEKKFDKLGKKTQSAAPKLFNYEKKLLLYGFYSMAEKLKEAARTFYAALDSSVNRDKGSFYAFLGSLEMPEFHLKLETVASLQIIHETNPNGKESDIHSTLTRSMDDVFKNISETQKNKMYFNVRTLTSLKELSSFSFDHLLMSFGTDRGVKTCLVNKVKAMLITLNNVLFSLKELPSLSLMQSLFVFMLHEKKSAPEGFDMDREIRTLLASAEEAVETIKQFHKKVPLTQILRCVCRDMTIEPRQTSGGEDWFFAYRDHWKHRLESAFSDFIRQRKQREISELFDYFFKDVGLKVLANAASDVNPNGFPLPEAFALAFLQTFYSAFFVKAVETLIQPILFEGVFVRHENRDEFTGAFSDFMRIEEVIGAMDRKIAPYGEYGMHYEEAKRGDKNIQPARMKKMRTVAEEASWEAKSIITRAITSLTSMVNVFGGILRKNSGDKYETLSNLEKLGSKKPEAFVAGLADTHEKLQRVLQVLKDLEATGHSR